MIRTYVPTSSMITEILTLTVSEKCWEYFDEKFFSCKLFATFMLQFEYFYSLRHFIFLNYLVF